MVSYSPEGVVDRREFEHKIVRVALKNSEEYILDPAGAQFRQYRAAMPFSQYKDKYVERIEGEENLGYYGTRWAEAAKFRDDPRFPPGFDYSGVWVQNEISKAVNCKIEAWEEESGKTVAAMLKQKQALFETDKVAFLQVIKTAVRDWIEQWEAKGKVIPPAEPRR